MSLSRPVKFPLLKLPWLCIKCVIHNLYLFNIIYFAMISNRTRRIVQHSKYPLNYINVHLNGSKYICMRDQNTWFFSHDTLDALKMAIEFMIDVFRCTVRYIIVDGDRLSELIGLGISSAKVLHISNVEPVDMADLKRLLETLKVTDEYIFNIKIPKGFCCDPRIFKCRKLYFGGHHSADWVTYDILCQFDVPKLSFPYHSFSRQDIVSYVTHWFNSENRKLEYFFVNFNDPISFEDFKIDHLNPMPFCKKRRNRCPLVEGWKNTDMSSGKDILREDGLLATFFVKTEYVLFYIWHKRFPDTV